MGVIDTGIKKWVCAVLCLASAVVAAAVVLLIQLFI